MWDTDKPPRKVSIFIIGQLAILNHLAKLSSRCDKKINNNLGLHYSDDILIKKSKVYSIYSRERTCFKMVFWFSLSWLRSIAHYKKTQYILDEGITTECDTYFSKIDFGFIYWCDKIRYCMFIHWTCKVHAACLEYCWLTDTTSESETN